MKFFAWFAVATLVVLLIARFKPQSSAEPIIPVEAKEAQGQPGADDNAPPARTEEQGKADAQKSGTTYFAPSLRLSSAA
ncbi:hypothetical protein QMK33_12780 [Hymenobacter sp. H14-R3]|uniref:hypothetical protein n=1 Tax=Hymenobacter sp. H14-R3 TaxID=3046308 RepID=UPI0024B94086|nr:hypothetical protein [Hymenobacter sp. H14-R3]MDJ0366031.1 hypothetical protein [Hymenobacter sp. H14-R3]